jgi:hypothetical protein
MVRSFRSTSVTQAHCRMRLRLATGFDGVTENGATVEEFMSWVHPDDAERVWAAFYAALDPAEPKRSATEFQLRLRDDGFSLSRRLGRY